jgi:hypothetical protein
MKTGLPNDPSLPSNLSEWGSQDVAIASFLMLLWKDMYPARNIQQPENEWDTWGRPEGGFVDLGCVSAASAKYWADLTSGSGQWLISTCSYRRGVSGQGL